MGNCPQKKLEILLLSSVTSDPGESCIPRGFPDLYDAVTEDLQLAVLRPTVNGGVEVSTEAATYEQGSNTGVQQNILKVFKKQGKREVESESSCVTKRESIFG